MSARSHLDQLARLAADAEPPALDDTGARRLVERALASIPAPAPAQRSRSWMPVLALSAAGCIAVTMLLMWPRTPAAPSSPELLHLTLPSGDRLVGVPGARFELEDLTPAHRRMRLRRGTLLVDVAHIVSPQRFEVVTDHVRTPTRPKPRSWTVVHRKAAVIVAPMTHDEKIVLIRQERVPIRATIWEMPSGQIDKVVEPDRGEIKAVALSELREEAGYELSKDGELIALGHYFSSPGFTDERGYFFLARPVEPCANYVRDEAESIVECREFGVEELKRMIAGNEIRDANTLSMWARLEAGGFLSPDRR